MWTRWVAADEGKPRGVEVPAQEKPACLRIDPDAQRYPCCLVWTPIHPLTWLVPFAGHVGLGDREGIVHDFAGRLGRDAMAFGWPARYVQLSPKVADWAKEVERSREEFSRVEYGLFTWNCHSFLAGFLNNSRVALPSWTHRAYGCWTVAGVAGHMIVHGHYLGRGRLQQWAGTVVTSGVLLWAALSYGAWDLLGAWVAALVGSNAFFIAWFAILAPRLVRDSQRGRVPDDAVAPEHSDDDEFCRTGM